MVAAPGRECYPAPMTSIPISNIRNFAIVAHIDHGKSTLADRLIQTTGGLQAREMKEQVLDSMDIERERGITIKAQTVRLNYRAKDGKDYILNLMDTPGHVDFAYEVSRSLAACEGSLLVVDASQGVEAQTLANVYHAIDAGHEIVPVLNKIDLPAAEPDQVKQQIEDVIGIDASDAVMISAKTGLGIDDVLEAIVHRLPPPKGDREASLKALLVDSWYDVYLGVVVLVRIVDGVMKKGQRIRMMGTNAAYDVERVGFFTPKMQQIEELGPGEIGFITAAIKEVADTRVGDTITDDRKPVTRNAAGLQARHPGGVLRPVSGRRRRFRNAASGDGQIAPQRRQLFVRNGNLGRVGIWLPLRLPRPVTSRNHPGAAAARVRSQSDRDRTVRDLQDAPHGRAGDRDSQSHRHAGRGEGRRDRGAVDRSHDTDTGRISRQRFETVPGPPRLAKRAHLCRQSRAMVKYELPLNEVVFDFYDRLKSVSKGYASFDYHLTDYKPADLVKMQILVNNESVDALSMLVHRQRAEGRGRAMVEKMKELIPPHMFQIPIQAAIGGKVIARETVRALRKDVTAKCYGGDITRKRKLLEKQKEGKKKMRQFGKVDIPQEAFIAALKVDS